MTEELDPDDFDPAALAEIAEQARRKHQLPSAVQTIGTTPILNDPAAWALERRIAVAREAALTAGEDLPALGDWRTSDMPEDVRTCLAHWYAVGCSKFWETECEGIRAAARAPFLAFSAAVAAAIPRRYSDARQLPPKNDPEHEAVRAMLQKRVKSPVAYRMALAALVCLLLGRLVTTGNARHSGDSAVAKTMSLYCHSMTAMQTLQNRVNKLAYTDAGGLQ
jgi:hypothetical protein